MYPLSHSAVEGWILMVTNLNEEIQEDDVFDFFSKFGEIKGLHLNMDRRTGYAKGYALLEYANLEEAQEAIKEGNGEELLDKRMRVDWAFQDKPLIERIKPKN